MTTGTGVDRVDSYDEGIDDDDDDEKKEEEDGDGDVGNTVGNNADDVDVDGMDVVHCVVDKQQHVEISDNHNHNRNHTLNHIQVLLYYHIPPVVAHVMHIDNSDCDYHNSYCMMMNKYHCQCYWRFHFHYLNFDDG